MSHFIDTAAFAVKPAWHGLGHVLPHHFTSAEGIKAAGLDWNVVKVPTFIRTTVLAADGVDTREQDTGYFAVVRDDRNTVIGNVGPDYEPLQNRDAFGFLDELAADGSVRYESAGALKGGRTVWMLVQLPGGSEVVDGDQLLPFVLLTNSHDGSSAVRAMATSVRVVCWNTLTLALRENRKARALRFSIRHVGSVGDRVRDAIAAIKAARKGFEQHTEQARALAKVDVGGRDRRQDVTDYLATLFPEMAAAKPSGRARKRAERILENWLYDSRNLTAGRGTAWGLYNAVSQYLDHERVPDAEKRFETATVGGQWVDVKERAWAGALELAGVAI